MTVVRTKKQRASSLTYRRRHSFGCLVSLAVALCLAVTARAASHDVSFNRSSSFADTQVSTNVPINRTRCDVGYESFTLRVR